MRTKFFISLSNGSSSTMMTSSEQYKVSDLWHKMLSSFTDSGARVVEYHAGHFVVLLDGIKRECRCGTYSFEDTDPYINSITL